MIFKEEKKNLFEVDDKYLLAHCISADYALGAGIATIFQKVYHLKNNLKIVGKKRYPDCIFINPVFNLVTKEKYWHKPTYQSLQRSLEMMKKMLPKDKLNYIAMPKIGCGLDGLQWSRVKEIIEEVFKDINIEILICYL